MVVRSTVWVVVAVVEEERIENSVADKGLENDRGPVASETVSMVVVAEGERTGAVDMEVVDRGQSKKVVFATERLVERRAEALSGTGESAEWRRVSIAEKRIVSAGAQDRKRRLRPRIARLWEE